LAVGATVTSSWKIVKWLEIFVHGTCEVVVELATFVVEEKLAL
jgi:hypothetical protein